MGKHANSPLTPEGWRRLCERIDDGRPISHVADEGGVSRQRLTIWYRRWEKEGAFGLEDHSSRPLRSPNVTPDELVAKIEELRRERKWGPDRISGYLTLNGDPISQGAVYKVLVRLGLNHRRAIDRITGEDKIAVQRYEKGHPGDMVHIDVKKVGKIPDGGGWRVHGRDSEQALKSKRKANHRPGYTYIHACVDDNSRIAYAEALNDEKAVTAIAFFERARIFLATHGIEVKAVLTDNGSAYISGLWKAACRDAGIKHQRTRRQTPKTNGKVERFNLTMKDEWLYVRAYMSEEERRAALVPFLNNYNHDRPHSAIGNRPPISRAPTPGLRLDGQPIVAPERTNDGQLTLDLHPELGDNNVGEET